MGFRCYVDNTKDGNYNVLMWKRDAQEIVIAERFRVRATTGNQWHQTWRLPRYRVDTSIVYRFAVLYGGGARYQTNNALTSAVTHSNITFENGFTTTAIHPVLATITLLTTAMGVDVLFEPD